MTAEDFARTKISQEARKRGVLRFPCHFFFADGHHQASSPDPAMGVCRGTYSHEGPAQVDGCAAPVHGVIQDAEGEAGHFGLHQNAEVITCRASKRVSRQAPRRWESRVGFETPIPSPCRGASLPGMRAKVNEGFRCRFPG